MAHGQCVAPPPGVSAWFTFDEPQWKRKGPTAPEVIAGHVGNALRFDGKTQFVEFPNGTPGIDFGRREFSMELWIRTKSPATMNVILDKRDQERRGYHLFLWKGNVGAQVSDSSKTNNVFGSGPGIADGNWHHLAVVVQRLPRVPLKLFLDGKLHATGEFPTSLVDLDVAEPLWLGRHHANVLQDAPNFFAGDMDELTFYRRVLKPEEITAIYRAGRAGKCRAKVGF